MTDQDQATQLKRALQAIKDLRAKLETVERARTEPIAIVGMACRFPGADSIDAFWQLLKNRGDAITPVPSERWEADSLYDADADAKGKVTMRFGGFVSAIDQFDPYFFGISPREAASMDPQQRLLAEVTWEAFEDAGIPVEKLAGSSTGVFIGVHSHSSDYFLMQCANPDAIDIYTGTGTAHNVVSGRLAYLFDLHGPNVAVDTACSSSLVAVHLAVASLRNRECNLAIAGGVNAILSPHFTIAASRMRMLAPDGRCKTFDASADGFVRGEGCGVVLLKRLADALANDDPILALIRGSAMNQDGRTNGMTAPNGLAQQAVIRLALDNAGIEASQISYVETHGTGTPLGDPVEVEALAATVGEPRQDAQACVLGSVKTNVGHLEGAAGIAGLIKTVLALQKETIPANLHFHQLNPHIALAGTRLQIASEEHKWNFDNRFAGVSSFGWSGTNAHVIVEQAPSRTDDERRTIEENPFVLPISARNEKALRELGVRFKNRLGDLDQLGDLCYTAGTRRSHHDYRLAVTGRTRDELIQAIDFYLRGEPNAHIATGRKDARQPGLVFVFPGQGGQWFGMARQLLTGEPVFRAAIERCEQAFKTHVDWSLIEQLNADAEHSRLNEIDVIQPTLFAIQVALAKVWRAWGVVPDAVVGHSLGEIAAAHVAGALSLQDAVRVICERSRLMRRVSGRGAMAVVDLSVAEAQSLIDGLEDRLSMAVSNSPRSTVLAGDPEALEKILNALRAKNIFCRAVKVDVASHSPQMEPLRDELKRALMDLSPQSNSISIYSTVTGDVIDGTELNADYWSRNLRQPVLFSAAVQKLLVAENTVFIELNPHPILLASIQETLAHLNTQGITLPSTRREEDEQLVMRGSLAGLYAAGYPVDWSRIYATGHIVRLPSYPWQHERYWIDVPKAVTNWSWDSKPIAQFDASWLYQIEWRAKPWTAGKRAQGHWLVVADHQGIGIALSKRLSSRGDSYELVESSQVLGRIASIVREKGLLHGIVYLPGLDLTNESFDLDNTQVTATLDEVRGIVQAIALQPWTTAPRLWTITRGAQAVDQEKDLPIMPQVPLWGFGRVLALEHPELLGGLIDLPLSALVECATLLLNELEQTDGEDQIAFRNGERFVARLGRFNVPTKSPVIHSDATYLITGGLGHLGVRVADWLVSLGARHLVLVGRTGLPDRNQWNHIDANSPAGQRIAEIRRLEARGAKIDIKRANVADKQQMQALLIDLHDNTMPLRGIIHAAGVAGNHAIVDLDTDLMQPVLQPKVVGSWVLHRLTEDMKTPLDFFVMFSSAASVWGSQGLAHYAAANHFMDMLAHYRKRNGLVASSVNWGWWSGEGMADANQTRLFEQVGLRAMQTEPALVALASLLAAGTLQAIVADVDWKTFKSVYQARRERPFLEQITVEAQTVSKMGVVRDELEHAPPDKRLEHLRNYVGEQVADVLGLDSSHSLDSGKGFFQQGMDSLTTVQLRNRLQADLGCQLPTTLAFEYPTVEALAEYLARAVLHWMDSPISPTQSGEPGTPARTEELSESEMLALLENEIDAANRLTKEKHESHN